MDFYTKYYSQLINFVVTGFELETDEFDGSVFPVLLMMHPDGTKVRLVVSSDEEGNSGGHLIVEEVR